MPAIRKVYAKSTRTMAWKNLLTEFAQEASAGNPVGVVRIAGMARSYKVT